MAEWDRARDVQARATRLATDSGGSTETRGRITSMANRIASEISANSASLVGDANAVNLAIEGSSLRGRLEKISYDVTKLRADCEAAASPGTSQSGVTLRD